MQVARREMKVDRIPKAIDNYVDFCCFPSSAGSDMLVDIAIFRPFFAPALCWCACEQVLSILISCKSASNPSSAMIF